MLPDSDIDATCPVEPRNQDKYANLVNGRRDERSIHVFMNALKVHHSGVQHGECTESTVQVNSIMQEPSLAQ